MQTFLEGKMASKLYILLSIKLIRVPNAARTKVWSFSGCEFMTLYDYWTSWKSYPQNLWITL